MTPTTTIAKKKTLFQEFNLSNYIDPQVATANLGGTDEKLRVNCYSKVLLHKHRVKATITLEV